ncbi:MAG: hypothetical protein KF819_16555 [Labilithrix sp.]|nr:hypothetical protein [Labilithrix sp.]
MRRSVGTVAMVFILVACRGSTVPTGDVPQSAPPIAPASAASTQTPIAATACLMVNVCNCNLGCAAIRVEPTMVREGTRAKVVSGALEGQEVKIVRVVDAAGASVLALTDLDHDFACSLAAERAVMGYACEAKKSGPVPAKACAAGCDP